MNKFIQKLSFSTVLFAGILTGCTSTASKVENAEENVKKEQEDVVKANENLKMEIENYRKESVSKIDGNDQRIAEVRAQAEKDKSAMKSEVKTQIADLEKKNAELRTKLNDYQSDKQEDWDNFKKELNHDMDELGNSLRDFGQKNLK
ncbi:MAG TPA: peptidase M23 [Flavobacteriales bacterium]|nr:peptidase M23 [Flavobacteriales bacterium]